MRRLMRFVLTSGFGMSVFAGSGGAATWTAAEATEMAQLMQWQRHPGPRLGCSLCDALESRHSALVRSGDRELFVPTGRDVQSARTFLTLGKFHGGPPLVIMNKSNKTEWVPAFLDSKPRSAIVIHDIARDEAAAIAIHGVQPGEVLADRFELNKDLASSLDARGRKMPSLRVFDMASIQRVADAVRAKHAAWLATPADQRGLFMVIGHVVRGRILFHDGSSVAVDELRGMWVIGCNTAQFVPPPELLELLPGLGIGNTISYEKAIKIVNDVVDTIENNGTVREAAEKWQENDEPAVLIVMNKETLLTVPQDIATEVIALQWLPIDQKVKVLNG